MSKLDNLVRSKGYKDFMAKLYGWGAAVVIVGALFKINHWPGGTVMLILGMGVEAVIFFLSAFEPPHTEWDWSLAYPELAGIKDENEVGHKSHVAGSTSQPVTQQLDKMLEDAKIGPELIDRLGAGMQNLAESANSLNNMGNAVAATDKFVSNMDVAANAVGELSTVITNDLQNSSSYSNSLKEATDAVTSLSSIYRETAQTLRNGDTTYLDELKKMATSLSSINAMYEIQLQNSTSQLEATKQVQERIQTMVSNFAESADDVLKYKEQVAALTNKVSELNKVYGSMLAAMQTRI